MAQDNAEIQSLYQKLMSLTPEERSKIENHITESYSLSNHPSTAGNALPFILKTEDGEDSEIALLPEPEPIVPSIYVPPWIYEYEENSKKVYTLNLANFDIPSFLGDELHQWCIEGVLTSTWATYCKQIKRIVLTIRIKLESFYSTDADPKITPKVTSTERHYISACLAYIYPLLANKYIDFKIQFLKKENIGCTVYMSTFKSLTFMEFFYDKLSTQLTYVPRDIAELLGPIPKKKPRVSDAMKRSAKEKPRRMRVVAQSANPNVPPQQ